MPFDSTSSDDSSGKKDKKKKLYFPDDVGKLDIRIGRILEVKTNPFARRKKPCFVAEVDVGEDVPRTVGNELNHFYKEDELINRLVVVLCNVYPRTKCNMVSDAWILSARNDEKHLELLNPPQNCEEGEQVVVEGFPLIPDIRDEKNLKAVMIKRILQEVRVGEGKVVGFRRRPLKVEGREMITTQTLADCIITDSFLNFTYEQSIEQLKIVKLLRKFNCY